MKTADIVSARTETDFLPVRSASTPPISVPGTFAMDVSIIKKPALLELIPIELVRNNVRNGKTKLPMQFTIPAANNI